MHVATRAPMANHNPLSTRGAVDGQMSANTWALTLILHRTQRVADEAINRALDCSLTSHRGAPWCNGMLPCATRQQRDANSPSCCRTVTPWTTTIRRVRHRDYPA